MCVSISGLCWRFSARVPTWSWGYSRCRSDSTARKPRRQFAVKEKDRKGWYEAQNWLQVDHSECALKRGNFRDNLVTCSANNFACSMHPRLLTWVTTSSTLHFAILCRSLDEKVSSARAAWSSLSPLQRVLPSGQGKENGDTCCTPFSATEKKLSCNQKARRESTIPITCN